MTETTETTETTITGQNMTIEQALDVSIPLPWDCTYALRTIRNMEIRRQETLEETLKHSREARVRDLEQLREVRQAHEEELKNIASEILSSDELDRLGACREGRIEFIRNVIGDYLPTTRMVVVGELIFSEHGTSDDVHASELDQLEYGETQLSVQPDGADFREVFFAGSAEVTIADVVRAATMMGNTEFRDYVMSASSAQQLVDWIRAGKPVESVPSA